MLVVVAMQGGSHVRVYHWCEGPDTKSTQICSVTIDETKRQTNKNKDRTLAPKLSLCL